MTTDLTYYWEGESSARIKNGMEKKKKNYEPQVHSAACIILTRCIHSMDGTRSINTYFFVIVCQHPTPLPALFLLVSYPLVPSFLYMFPFRCLFVPPDPDSAQRPRHGAGSVGLPLCRGRFRGQRERLLKSRSLAVGPHQGVHWLSLVSGVHKPNTNNLIDPPVNIHLLPTRTHPFPFLPNPSCFFALLFFYLGVGWLDEIYIYSLHTYHTTIVGCIFCAASWGSAG